MAFQSVPETAQIDVVFQQNDVIVQNSFYGRRPGGYSLANLQELADDIDTVIPIAWLPHMSIDCLYLRTDVRGLQDANDLVVTQNAGSGIGSDVTPPFPNNVTLSIKKSSGLTGRSARGRLYWVSIPKDKDDGGNENLLDPVYVAQLVSSVGTIRTNIDSTENWNPVLVSRFLDGVKRPVGVTFAWTGESAVNNVVDTQRGRLP